MKQTNFLDVMAIVREKGKKLDELVKHIKESDEHEPLYKEMRKEGFIDAIAEFLDAVNLIRKA